MPGILASVTLRCVENRGSSFSLKLLSFIRFCTERQLINRSGNRAHDKWKAVHLFSARAAWCCNKCCGVSVSDLSELVVLLCEKLQELGVACCLGELQRRDSLLIWKTDGHQTARLAKQQLRQPIHSPSHSQVKGRLPETVLWRGGQMLQKTLKTKTPAYWETGARQRVW